MNQAKFINLAGMIIMIIGGILIGLKLSSGETMTDFLANSAQGILFVALGLGFLAIGKKVGNKK